MMTFGKRMALVYPPKILCRVITCVTYLYVCTLASEDSAATRRCWCLWCVLRMVPLMSRAMFHTGVQVRIVRRMRDLESF